MSIKQDINGKDSAKRKFGAILIIVDIIIFILLVVVSIYFTIFEDAKDQPIELLTPMLYDMWLLVLWMGTSLIGLTIAEHVFSFIKSKKGVS